MAVRSESMQCHDHLFEEMLGALAEARVQDDVIEELNVLWKVTVLHELLRLDIVAVA